MRPSPWRPRGGDIRGAGRLRPEVRPRPRSHRRAPPTGCGGRCRRRNAWVPGCSPSACTRPHCRLRVYPSCHTHPRGLGLGRLRKPPKCSTAGSFFEFYSMVRSSGYRSHVFCNFHRKCSTLDTLGKVPSETKATLRGPEVQAEVDSAHQGLQILGFLGPENRKPASNTLSRARMAHLLVHSFNKCPAGCSACRQ